MTDPKKTGNADKATVWPQCDVVLSITVNLSAPASGWAGARPNGVRLALTHVGSCSRRSSGVDNAVCWFIAATGCICAERTSVIART